MSDNNIIDSSHASIRYQLLSRIIKSKPIRIIVAEQIKLLNYLIVNVRNNKLSDYDEEFVPLKRYSWYELEKNATQLIQYRYYNIFIQQFDRYLSKYANNDFTRIMVEKFIRFSLRNGHQPIIDYLLSTTFKGRDLIDISGLVNLEVSSIFYYGYFDIIQRYISILGMREQMEALESASSGKQDKYLLFIIDHIIKNDYIFEKAENSIIDLNPINSLLQEGHLEHLKYLLKEMEKKGSNLIYNWKLRPSTYSIEVAAINGHLDVIEYVLSNYKTTYISHNIVDQAAASGHLEVIKRIDVYLKGRPEMREPEVFCTIAAMDAAAREGHLEVVKWLHFNRTEGCTTEAMDYAAQNGHLEIIKWLHENRTEGCTDNAIGYAAIGNHLEVVKFLHFNRTEGCNPYFIEEMQEHPFSLDIIKFINENLLDLEWSDSVLIKAAEYGDLESVKYITAHHPEEGFSDAMQHAALRGHLNIVKWFYEHLKEKCTRSVISMAAEGGHLEVVKYVFENSKKHITSDAINRAIEKNHFEVLRFLVLNSNTVCNWEAVSYAAKNGNLDMIKYLYNCYGTDLPVRYRTIANAVEGGNYDVVTYLHKEFSVCSEPSCIIETASNHRQLAIMEYLLDRGQIYKQNELPIKKSKKQRA